MSTYSTWKSVRAKLTNDGQIDEERVAELQKQMLAEGRAHRLAEVREGYDVSQTELAKRIGVSQSRVSRIERGDLEHAELATIRDYVEALGGKVEVVAKFGDEHFVIA